MCGFLTILDQSGQFTLNHKALLDEIQHRGPDAEGQKFYDLNGNLLEGPIICQPHLAMGHRRLSILDLDPRSNQPMASGDGRYSLVYNGEVYNYVELRETLKIEGCSFYTDSDTEVVLQAMVHWGPEQALTEFQGMFAFSLLDRLTGTLTIARDQLGIKPLFQVRWTGGYAWASEVWPLLSLPGVSRAPNMAKIAQYMTSGGQEHDGMSYFEAIERVSSGCYNVVQLRDPAATPSCHRYWSLDVPNRLISVDDAVPAFREAFLKNVRLHLRSDVPLGVALSGGLDSSALVGAIRHLEPDIELKTFSFLPNNPRWSEKKWIKMCNTHVGAIPSEVMPEPQDLVDDIQALIRAQGEPFGTTSIYAQFRVMRLSAETGVKVILDGQGADELLGGYAPYLSARILSLLQAGKIVRAANLFSTAPSWAAASHSAVLQNLAKYMLPRSFTRGLRRRASRRAPYDWLLPETVSLAKIFTPGAEGGVNSERFLKRTLKEATIHYGLPELLRYEDRNSMHFSLESRVPFLTAEFTKLCISLPEEVLIDRQGRTKAILRDAIRGLVPDAIIDRRDKIGFRPDEAAMNRPIAKQFLDEAPSMALPEGIDWDSLLSRMKSISGDEFSQPWLWRAINLGTWHHIAQHHPTHSA